MPANRTLAVLTIAAALMGACGRRAEAPDQADSPPEPASAPAEPSPAQVKALLAALPAPFDTGDPAHGKHVFVLCEACHTNTQGGPNMTGPNLYGLFGRKAGSVAGYSYSDAVKTAGLTWSAPLLDRWITAPRDMLPGTKMSFIGLKDPKDRADVIAYLKVSTTPAPPLP